ncbi:hypothetical protein [Cytobacillus praedii]|uniref:Uncharacterized protein n=1 Tax=Cytobacillus praedii TaxID=1742358 RepID=A0A4R1ARP9_9BACI|nr:hypothetical protein [Cytobacillus praedii]TCJ02213.1 hypothetical protein E0Y62_20280 [Cytobacillus praedii]
MQLIKHLTFSFLGGVTGLLIYYFATGKDINWTSDGIFFAVIVLITLIAKGKLGKKLNSKNK